MPNSIGVWWVILSLLDTRKLLIGVLKLIYDASVEKDQRSGYHSCTVLHIGTILCTVFYWRYSASHSLWSLTTSFVWWFYDFKFYSRSPVKDRDVALRVLMEQLEFTKEDKEICWSKESWCGVSSGRLGIFENTALWTVFLEAARKWEADLQSFLGHIRCWIRLKQ